MTITPSTSGRPQVEISLSGIEGEWGNLYRKFEFKATLNGGYVVKCLLFDPDFKLAQALINNGYFENSRNTPLTMTFKIKSGPDNDPNRSTKRRSVKIVSIIPRGENSQKGMVEFVGIDLPSWYLNIGEGAGRTYTGKLSQVIREVVSKYAPDVQLNISETIDSRSNKWFMMRQDPRTFITSLLEWSTPLTNKKTQWIIASTEDNNRPILNIKEQAELQSKQRAFYRFNDGLETDTINSWNAVANNALSSVQTKIITQGISAISGRYFDRITDKEEQIVVVKDTTTANKITADVPKDRTFTKPSEDGSIVGTTAIPALPELNGGELGLRYDEYIDGRARSAYLGMLNSLLKVKFRVLGHGEWSDCEGLGIDTIYVKWMLENNTYWLTGNWLVYGFHHIVERTGWWTDVFATRYDYNSESKKVGGSVIT